MFELKYIIWILCNVLCIDMTGVICGYKKSPWFDLQIWGDVLKERKMLIQNKKLMFLFFTWQSREPTSAVERGVTPVSTSGSAAPLLVFPCPPFWLALPLEAWCRTSLHCLCLTPPQRKVPDPPPGLTWVILKYSIQIQIQTSKAFWCTRPFFVQSILPEAPNVIFSTTFQNGVFTLS